MAWMQNSMKAEFIKFPNPLCISPSHFSKVAENIRLRDPLCICESTLMKLWNGRGKSIQGSLYLKSQQAAQMASMMGSHCYTTGQSFAPSRWFTPETEEKACTKGCITGKSVNHVSICVCQWRFMGESENVRICLLLLVGLISEFAFSSENIEWQETLTWSNIPGSR